MFPTIPIPFAFSLLHCSILSVDILCKFFPIEREKILHLQPVLGPDGKMKEPESNVLRASIENMKYAVTVDVLRTMSHFSHPSVYIWSRAKRW
ncbi:hypothetical protein B296_00039193 [Ensete ventricosum]|uniref:Uncharacterized protein n=1 Tax=Ensete ventricosum TaxID=4639 RepID=A0A426ZU88_ENSVE|nr:hypothetical protein B296_00039193 [Ensete ventricosum]